jgi:hypothetical protein
MTYGNRNPSTWRILCRLSASVTASVCLSSGVAEGQQGYGSYYGQTVTKTHGQLGAQSSSRYLYDEYFYKRSTVSPYINLGRLDTMGGDAYQSYVRPEQQRREQTKMAQAVYLDARKKEGRVGETRFPGATYGGGGTAIMKPLPKRPNATPSAYHNHWYGGWAK